MPTADPESYIEVLEGLLGRQGLALATCRRKDTDRGSSRKMFLLLLFGFALIHFFQFFFNHLLFLIVFMCLLYVFFACMFLDCFLLFDLFFTFC